MRILTRKLLRDFSLAHADARGRLDRWYSIFKREDFDNFNAIREFFPDADAVGNFVIFNIGGNNYRIAAKINYKAKIIYIRRVMTHAEYSKNLWKEDPWFQE